MIILKKLFPFQHSLIVSVKISWLLLPKNKTLPDMVKMTSLRLTSDPVSRIKKPTSSLPMNQVAIKNILF